MRYPPDPPELQSSFAAIAAGGTADVGFPDGSRQTFANADALRAAYWRSYEQVRGPLPRARGPGAAYWLLVLLALASWASVAWLASRPGAIDNARAYLGGAGQRLVPVTATAPSPTALPARAPAPPTPTPRPPVRRLASATPLFSTCARTGRPLATLEAGWEVTLRDGPTAPGWQPVSWADRPGCIPTTTLRKESP